MPYKNIEDARAFHRRRYQKTKAVRLACARRYDAKFPERKRERERERYRWERAGDVTAAQLKELVERCGGLCFYCGAPVVTICRKFNCRGFDHIIPRPKGGQHTITNMVVCCWPCNRKKATY